MKKILVIFACLLLILTGCKEYGRATELNTSISVLPSYTIQDSDTVNRNYDADNKPTEPTRIKDITNIRHISRDIDAVIDRETDITPYDADKSTFQFKTNSLLMKNIVTENILPDIYAPKKYHAKAEKIMEKLVQMHKSNTDNVNLITGMQTVTSKPDLTITMEYEPTFLEADTTLHMYISNEGTAKATLPKLEIEIGDATTPGLSSAIQLRVLEDIKPGDKIDARQEITMLDPEVKVRAKIDSDNIIDETNENNNEAEITLKIKLPEDMPDLTPISATGIEKTTLKITNEGSETSEETTMNIYVDGEIQKTLIVPPVPERAANINYRNIETTLNMKDGNNEILVIVDPDDNIQESNEENNKKVFMLMKEKSTLTIGTIKETTTLEEDGIVIGTCDDLLVKKLISDCDELDSNTGIIRLVEHAGQNYLVIAAKTEEDVKKAIELFLTLDKYGDVQDEFIFRYPRSTNEEFYAEYEEDGKQKYYADYTFPKETLTLTGFPGEKTIRSIFGNADVEIYSWEKKWKIYRSKGPSDLYFVEPNRGYYVYSHEDQKITIKGEQTYSGTEFETGEVLFSPRDIKLKRLNEYGIFENEAKCPNTQLVFTTVNNPRIDIGEACWVTSTGGVLP